MESVATAIAVAVAAVLVVSQSGAVHKIEEGHVGVYYRGGALVNSISDPGYNLMIPFITSVRQIQVTLQKDEVKNVPCGTSGGVIVTFDRVEVVNMLERDHVLDTVRRFSVEYDRPLIFDKVHHTLNQFCSAHTLQEVYVDLFDQIDENLEKDLQSDLVGMAPGLLVLAVRVTKPVIPAEIARNYEQMEAEKTKLLIAQQHQRVVEKEAETERKRAVIEAEKVAAVAKINNEARIKERETEQEVSRINDAIYLAQQRARVDAEAYHMTKLAEAEKERFTPQYLQALMYQSVSNNSKVFFGPSVPSMFFWDSMVGRQPSQESP